MCELFGISAAEEVNAGEWLKVFFKHSDRNPHGWGLAAFQKNSGGHPALSSMEKEPLRADRSHYLRARLRRSLRAAALIAHIREATIGALEYCNTHPFRYQDESGRLWTLAHNGTIFEGALLQKYIRKQEGQTDSERILLYIVDQINLAQKKKAEDLLSAGEQAFAEHKPSAQTRFLTAGECGLSAEERCNIVDAAISALAPGNKLNLLLFDGDLLYVHCNLRGTLYRCTAQGAALFATVPFLTGSSSRWEEVPFTSVCAYRDGSLVYKGTPHGHEYREDPEKIRSLLMAYAAL